MKSSFVMTGPLLVHVPHVFNPKPSPPRAMTVPGCLLLLLLLPLLTAKKTAFEGHLLFQMKEQTDQMKAVMDKCGFIVPGKLQ